MKVWLLLLILTFMSDWSRWFIGPSRIAAVNKETSPCPHDNFSIISHDFYIMRACGRWLIWQEHLYNTQIVMNHRSCLRRQRGAVLSLNNELLKMESGVSDSRSIGSEAHMCWWAFHCRTGLISLQNLPSQTLIEFLTLHRREGTEDNIVHVCILFLIRYSACVFSDFIFWVCPIYDCPPALISQCIAHCRTYLSRQCAHSQSCLPSVRSDGGSMPSMRLAQTAKHPTAH